LKRARDSVRQAVALTGQVYNLTKSLPADWDRAEAAADGAIGLMQYGLHRDTLFAAGPEELNSVCWWGALAGRAREALPICELGVDRAPGDPMVRDSRGLARALVGDRRGAIADFTFFQNAMLMSKDTLDKKRGMVRGPWIEKLRRGENLDLRQVREEARQN
jgi:hypothetical protein